MSRQSLFFAKDETTDYSSHCALSFKINFFYARPAFLAYGELIIKNYSFRIILPVCVLMPLPWVTLGRFVCPCCCSHQCKSITKNATVSVLISPLTRDNIYGQPGYNFFPMASSVAIEKESAEKPEKRIFCAFFFSN